MKNKSLMTFDFFFISDLFETMFRVWVGQDHRIKMLLGLEENLQQFVTRNYIESTVKFAKRGMDVK